MFGATIDHRSPTTLSPHLTIIPSATAHTTSFAALARALDTAVGQLCDNVVGDAAIATTTTAAAATSSATAASIDAGTSKSGSSGRSVRTAELFEEATMSAYVGMHACPCCLVDPAVSASLAVLLFD